MIIFTPLEVGSAAFGLGTTLFALGLLGFIAALLNFRDTPPDEPATGGLYRVSRNPQAFTFFLANYGICIAIGSWLALLTLFLSQLCAHFRILAEEETCLRQYGDSYRAYMQRVPRYFVLF
jgi:protein-S-isoprenylcysteine O-methyltransferase Ste14